MYISCDRHFLYSADHCYTKCRILLGDLLSHKMSESYAKLLCSDNRITHTSEVLIETMLVVIRSHFSMVL
jgi:hypothetical protein